MADRKIQSRLQKFALKNLVRTSFGSDEETYQEDQLNAVSDEIRDIYASYPELPQMLDEGILLVPSADEISDVQMANIGMSATGCMQMIFKGQLKINDTEESVVPVIKAYLKAVIEQAQDGCRRMAEAKQRQEEIHKVVTERINEYFGDLQKKEDLFAQYVKQVESVSKNAEDSAQTAATKAFEASKKAEKAEEILATTIKSANNAKKTAHNAKKLAHKAENTADNIIPNMLAVLGIFVGVIVAVVACYLSVILAGQVEDSVKRTLPVIFMSYLVMGHIMIMTVFLLLYLISKLTSRSIANHCSRFVAVEKSLNASSCECDRCNNKCKPISRFGLTYSYILSINLIFIIGYFILLVWHIINTYYRVEFDYFAERNPWIVFGVVGILFVCIVAFMVACAFSNRKTKSKTA